MRGKGCREPTERRGSIANPAVWAEEKLGFRPDALQTRVLASGTPRGLLKLHAPVGQIDSHSSQGGTRSMHKSREPDAGGEPDGPAERGVRAQSGGVHETAGNPSEGGRRQRDFPGFPPTDRELWGLPGTEGTVRGFSAVSLLLVDEASRSER